MAVNVTMPQLGESVSEGTITRWLKNVGDTVSADEPLLEVSTDKVDTEIPSPASGVLLSIAAGEDDTVLVGAVLAVIGEASESAGAPAAPVPAPVVEAPAAAAPVVAAPVAAAPVSPVSPVASGSTEVTSVLLPALGESVTEGTVTRWLKSVGDAVAADEPLLEISTDKVDTEIPSPVAGTLLSIAVAEDETAAVGAVLATIGAVAAAPAPVAVAPVAAPVAVTPTAPAPAPTPTPTAPAPTPTAPAAPAAPAANADAYVTPLVRRLASEHGIDLATVTGTGVGGRIRKQDVLAAVEALTPAATPAAVAPAAASTASPSPAASSAVGSLRGSTEPLSRLRAIIAQRMVESLQVSAQLTTVVEVDVTRVATLRARAKSEFEAREGVKLTFMPFFALAAVEALKSFPQVNASIDLEARTVTYHEAEHLGIAVDSERGLLVPVVRDAGGLNLAGIAKAIADVAERTRSNKLSPDELSGGTFTLTNTGSRGALFDTPIINQPQVAILGTGTVVKRPVVVQDDTGSDVIAIRQMVYLALTYDHRLVDGADAARFLSTIKARLEDGAFESDLGL